MSTIGSYPTSAFSEDKKFLVLDPATQTTALVRGSDIVSYITPNLNAVNGETTRAAAMTQDYQVGAFVQTAGGAAILDGGNGMYLVVGPGEGDYPMMNGNELLLLPFGSLAGSNLDGALVTDDGVQVEIEDVIALRPIRFPSMEAVRLSTSSHDYIETSAFYEGGNTGGAKLRNNGTTGTPTGSGASVIAAALAADTFFNAAGVGYSLEPDQQHNHYMFGFSGGADETATISASITFTATHGTKLHWLDGEYNSDPIAVPDGSHWVFCRTAILQATTGYGASEVLLNFDGASNIVMECNSAVFRMLKSEYVSGEHRHLFNLVNCSNVTLINPYGEDSGGDIYYINGATDLLLINPEAYNARRNGCSVIKATRLRCAGTAIFRSSTGTAPQTGLVIEPNGPTDSLVDISFETVVTEDNVSDGLTIYLDDYKTGTPADVSISIGKLVSRRNGGRAFRISNVFLNSGSYGGIISVDEIDSQNDNGPIVSIADKAANAPFLSIGKVVGFNCCEGASSFSETAAIYISDTSASPSGGIHINSLSVTCTHTDMDYAVICEMGQGITDTRVNIENVIGEQVTPVRMNNITSSISEASDLITDYSKLIKSVAITTGTNIVATAHLGRTVTNLGASGSVTAALREYPTKKNPYKFRVEAAQTLAIDTFDAADRIVGTTGAGQTVTSNVVGAECEVFFIGTIGGVRYWQLNPKGNPASWTFN